MKKFLLWFSGFLTALFCSAQEKELLIIGTMHTVPAIVRNSYQPLLDYAVEYAPEAIYVEYIHPEDTLSLNVHAPEFLAKSDSLRQEFQLDEKYFSKIKERRLTDLTEDDFHFLSLAYLSMKDKANYLYYKYLSLYGRDGAKKPFRNENEDLTFKLAVEMGITYLFPIDDHQSDAAYYQAWDNAVREGKTNGDIKMLQQLIRQNKRATVLAAMRGKLGRYTNSAKALKRYDLMNSFRFTHSANAYSARVEKYWDQRNQRMAANLIARIKSNPYKKNILIVGAGHVVSLSNALKANYPELKVLLMCDAERESTDGVGPS